eukprot:scaffold1123_cov168-Amphora_coffeaeformis.AAC.17
MSLLERTSLCLMGSSSLLVFVAMPHLVLWHERKAERDLRRVIALDCVHANTCVLHSSLHHYRVLRCVRLTNCSCVPRAECDNNDANIEAIRVHKH